MALVTRILRRGISSKAYLDAKSQQKKRDFYDRILRVDHAGELGADRIYAGQVAVLGHSSVGPVIKMMWEQEKEHLQTFEQLLPKYRARPTVLYPLWHVAGWLLGAGSALLGKEGAMACTTAVEAVITEHYNDQIRELMTEQDVNKELLDVLKKFRDDEQHHHDIGVENDAAKAPGYDVLTKVIKTGCRSAIWIAERI